MVFCECSPALFSPNLVVCTLSLLNQASACLSVGHSPYIRYSVSAWWAPAVCVLKEKGAPFLVFALRFRLSPVTTTTAITTTHPHPAPHVPHALSNPRMHPPSVSTQVRNPICGMLSAYLTDALVESGLSAQPDTALGFTLLIVDRTLDLKACLLHDVTYQVCV
jgi:hypothetical protein